MKNWWTNSSLVGFRFLLLTLIPLRSRWKWNINLQRVEIVDKRWKYINKVFFSVRWNFGSIFCRHSHSTCTEPFRLLKKRKWKLKTCCREAKFTSEIANGKGKAIFPIFCCFLPLFHLHKMCNLRTFEIDLLIIWDDEIAMEGGKRRNRQHWKSLNGKSYFSVLFFEFLKQLSMCRCCSIVK